jgi:8-oxo-dGTP pyrophosphatase MutT (NUDIX family)
MRISERDGKVVVLDDDGVARASFGRGSRRDRMVLAAQYVAGELTPERGLARFVSADGVEPPLDPIAGPSPLDGLSDRQLAMREAFEVIEDAHGQWNQTAGADGAHYAPAKANPFRAQGLVCSNCTFWRPAPAGVDAGGVGAAAPGTGFCDIVSGDVEPEAVCKLWVIPADKVRETAAATTAGLMEDITSYLLQFVDLSKVPGAPTVPDAQVVAAGLMVRAADTGRVLMLQRALNATTCPGCGQVLNWDTADGGPEHPDGSVSCGDGVISDLVDCDPNAGCWEFPGGKLDDGEAPADAAVREWREEIGVNLPDGAIPSTGWTYGVYQGFLLDVPVEADIAINLPLDERPVANPDDLSETVAWWDPRDLPGLTSLRGELVDSMDAWMPLCMPGEVVDDPEGMDPQEMAAKKKEPWIPPWVKKKDGEDPKDPEAAACKRKKADDEYCDDVECAACKPRKAAAGKKKASASLTTSLREPDVQVARGPGVPSNFTVDVDGKTIVTTMAELGLGYWSSTPPGGGEYMSWLQARYVGGDRPNRNGALGTTSDLQHGFPTVAHGPLNFLHEERRIIGSICDAKFVPGAGTAGDGATGQETAAATTDPHIAVLAGAWRWVFPHEVYSMQAAEDSGLLAISMECVADEVQCAGDGGCGQSFAYDRFVAGDSCGHLKQRGAVKRMVRPTFLGAGVIVPPARPGWADADARMMAAEMAGSTYDQAGKPDVSASQWEALMGQVVRFARGA